MRRRARGGASRRRSPPPRRRRRAAARRCSRRRGSTSRRIAASRIAQVRSHGSTIAFTRIVPAARPRRVGRPPRLEHQRQQPRAIRPAPPPRGCRSEPRGAEDEEVRSAGPAARPDRRVVRMVTLSSWRMTPNDASTRGGDQELRHVTQPQPRHARLDDPDHHGHDDHPSDEHRQRQRSRPVGRATPGRSPAGPRTTPA